MEITHLKLLAANISLFFRLSVRENIKCDPVQRYYHKIEEILKLLKPVLDGMTDAEFASDEKLQKACADLGQFVEELREFFEAWQLLMSKVYFVLQVESVMVKVCPSVLEIFELLISSQCVLADLSKASLEVYAQKVQHIGHESTSAVIMQAVKEQVDGSGARSEDLVQISTSLSLETNQELLIEAVALERLKENAEQAEKNAEAEEIDQIIVLITHMHDCLVMLKQSQNHSPVAIPPDFCCPLSLELMKDPVIVSSGQTYERAFIQSWIDLGLSVCPKTRQMLAHTTLIPNYFVKALISNWCETHNVTLPDPLKSVGLNQPSLPPGRAESRATENTFAQLQLHSRVNHSASPDLNRPPNSPGITASSSSGIQCEESPSAHPRSSHAELDTERMPVKSSEDRCENDIDRSGQPSTSPSTENDSLAEELVPQHHNRSTSASNTFSNLRFSQGVSGGENEALSKSVAHSNDAMGKVAQEPPPAANLTTTEKESEFPSQLDTRSRSRTIWRRPTPDRFIPRIVSTAVNATRDDLSGLESQVKALVKDLQSTSVDVQRKATAEIRLLAKHNTDNRIVIANCGAINLLVSLLYSTDSLIQENAVTALLNLSINVNNKSAIANADAIEPLIYVLQTGSPEAKENSAATLFSLSVNEENKAKIGRSGAIKPLVDLLSSGSPRGKKDAATALFNLSLLNENKVRIVQDGAVKYLVELMDPAAGVVDKAVAVLSNLSTIQEGKAAIGQEGGIPVLIDVVELGSARGKENAAAALLQLCTSSHRYCNIVLQEGAVPPLVALSQSGTPRAKEKAQSLLSYFRTQRHGNATRG